MDTVRLALVVALLTVVGAACDGRTGPTPVGSISGSPPPPSASTTATETAGADAAPSSGAVAHIEDPDLSMRLPAGCEVRPIARLEADIQRMVEALPEAKEAYAKLLDDIEAGRVKLYAAGPAGLGPWTGTMLVEVTDGESVDAEVRRMEGLSRLMPRTREETDVSLGIGSGVRISVIQDPPANPPPGAIPAHGILYAVTLPDGRIFLLQASGPEASTTFADMIDEAVATLAVR